MSNWFLVLPALGIIVIGAMWLAPFWLASKELRNENLRLKIKLKELTSNNPKEKKE